MAKEKNMKLESKEMTLEEAKIYRASKHVPQERKLSMQEKREQFRIFWTQAKKKYGKAKNLEEIIWLHLVSIKKTDPKDFSDGVSNFGLKEIKK
jgi:hypothetical protein